MRRTILTLIAALAVSSMGVPSSHAKGRQGGADLQQPSGSHKPASPGDTVTWWCLDLNNLWHVDVPVIAGVAVLDYSAVPDRPIPDPGCASGFPVVVTGSSMFMPGGTFFWYTNKTYPPVIRAALEAVGHSFHSQSPSQDLLFKMSRVRVEIWTLDQETVIAEYSFDPHRFFRRSTLGAWDGMLQEVAYSDPALGIDLSPTAVRQLPLIGFPVDAGPIPPGTPAGMYWAAVYWTLSEEHWDGLGLDPNFNLLPAGEFLYGANRFWYEP